MEATIKQWGNSLGLRISKSLARQIGIEKDSVVRLTVSGDTLTIEPIRSRRARTERRPLSEYLEQITPENMHGETLTGSAVGREL
jgi:antitoxin MazE